MSSLPSTSSRKNFENWLRLLAFLKPYSFRFACGLLCALIYGLTSAALMKGIPQVLKIVFDDPNPSRSTVFLIVMLIPTIMITRAFANYLRTYLINWVGLRAITDLRQKVFNHIQTLSLDFFNRTNVGDLISRVANDCQQVQSAITTVVVDAVQHPFTVIVVATALLFKDWQFFLGAVVLAPLCILPITIYGRKVRKTSKLSQENQGEIISRLHENLTGVRVVKAFCMEQHEGEKFWKTCYQQFAYQMRIVRSTNILSPLIEIVAAFGVSVALYYAFQRHMHASDFWELVIGIFMLYEPIKGLSKLHTTIQKTLASTDRILAILDTRPTVVEASTAHTILPIKSHIRLEDVSFRYETRWILSNVTLTIPHGKTVALVGPSGAGKTTLMNLLLRFYDPTKGRIFLDDTDLRDASIASLRSQMAIVTQDTILFNDTIRNNLCYGTLQATEAQIEEAARKAHAHDFILHQPRGYDTVVGDKGVKLSGGQKQRLAIARAILRNPRILLLDEATSALDVESERFVQEALDELIQGRTVVVIAHRLSTVQRADLIVVMEHGSVLEQGHHEELLAGGNLYRKLHDLQFRDS